MTSANCLVNSPLGPLTVTVLSSAIVTVTSSGTLMTFKPIRDIVLPPVFFLLPDVS